LKNIIDNFKNKWYNTYITIKKGKINMKNKYGVPYHEYEIILNNGETKVIDVGCEEDWGDIQQMFDDNCSECVGWGNDCDGHIEITDVIDIENGKHLNPIEWAKNYVWCYVDNYSC
jgi:hypothetical protein